MYPYKVLSYYLDSQNYFGMQLSMFLDDKKGKCSYEKKPYLYKSQIYTEWEKLEKERGGNIHYTFTITNKQIQEYFSSSYSESHLFSIIFAHWWPLEQKQINLIASKENFLHHESLLEFFLQNGSIDKAKEVLMNSQSYEEKNHALHLATNEKYFIYKPYETIPATRNHPHSLIDNDGLIYQICF